MKAPLGFFVTSAICLGSWFISPTVFSAEQRHVAAHPGLAAPLGPPFQIARAVVPQQSRLVMYRVPNDHNAGVASIYINGAYHASLQRGGYSELCLLPGRFDVAVRTVQNGQPVRDGYDTRDTLNLEGGKATHVRVFHELTGRPFLMPVGPEKLLSEASNTRLQQHTISRVPQAVACQDAPPAAVVAAVTPAPLPVATPVPSVPQIRERVITLGADALFPFGQSSVRSISPQGRKVLDDLVVKIKAGFGPRDLVRIHIVGHADRFGSPAGNLKLSRERAAAIKDYFVSAGLPARHITTDGRGDREPVVTRCSRILSKESMECLKPNRRVVVFVNAKKTVETKK